jgi:hypothetical protein
MTEDRCYREQDAGSFMEIVPELNNPSPRIRALKILLDEFEYPSRDLRLAAQVLNCKEELSCVIQWLYREVKREIELETMFEDGDG